MNNIPLTGNSGDKNRKRAGLSILATATLVLSAVAFIGFGAIPQLQAFAQVSVTQSNSISQSASSTGTATAIGGDATVTQSINQFAAQSNIANINVGR
jgi:hypothetical protein